MPLEQINMNSEMDQRLSGNPQITFFKAVYRRHTPFHKGLYTYENFEIDNDTDLIRRFPISSRTYDLITNIFLENQIKKISPDTKSEFYANLGNTIIDNIVFRVGSTDLYKVDGLFLEAQAELEHPYVPSVHNGSSVPPIMSTLKDASLKCDTGSNYNVNTFAGGVSGSKTKSNTDKFFTYPNFYFCRSYGNAFPIVAVNNNPTELIITYNDRAKYSKLAMDVFEHTLFSSVNIEYVDLSDEERKRILNNSEPYIYYDISEYFYKTSTHFTYPIRQIFFIGVSDGPSASLSCNTPYSIIKAGITSITLMLNGENVYGSNDNDLDIYTKHNIYSAGYPGFGRKLLSYEDTPKVGQGYWDSIGVYTFCLNPMEQTQPDGHLPTNTEISITITPHDKGKNCKVYTENIRFFHILGGQLSQIYI